MTMDDITRTRLIDAWWSVVQAHNVRPVDVTPGYYGSHRSDVKPDVLTREDVAAFVYVDGTMPDGAQVELTLAECNDYGGSSLDRANIRTMAGWPGVETEEDRGAWSESRAWMVLGETPADHETGGDVTAWCEWLESHARDLNYLADYPLLDDESHSELETELADDAWDQWLGRDVLRSLDNMIGEVTRDQDDYVDHEEFPVTADYADDPRDREDIIRDVYYTYAGEHGEWTCEGANSATNLRHDDAVRHVAETVFGLNVPDCAHTEPSSLPVRDATGRWDGVTFESVPIPCQRPAETRGYCNQHAHRYA